MDITRENISELNDIIKIKIEENDFIEVVEKALKDYRKKANLPGFRPGRVPMGYIRKAYGKSAKADEINKMLSESLFNYLKTEKIQYLGEPIPYHLENEDKVDFENDKEFEFAFEIGISPEIELELNNETIINFYKVTPEEKYINSTIEDNQKRLSTETEIDEISEDEDMLRADFAQVDENKALIENGVVALDVLVAINMVKDDELKEKFKGLKIGDSIDFNPLKAFENETEVAALLKIDKENTEGLNADYLLSVKKIIRYTPAELNEKFYKGLFGEETTVSNEEELKEEIKKKIAQEFESESEAQFFLDFKDKMITELDISLPMEFLKKWIKLASKENKELDDETFDKEFPKFAEDLKWQIISGNIFQKNELKVDDAATNKAAEELVIADLKRYGLPPASINAELVQQFVHSMLEKEEDKERVKRKAEQEVLTNFIKATIKLDEKEISIDEFNDLNKTLEEK